MLTLLNNADSKRTDVTGWQNNNHKVKKHVVFTQVKTIYLFKYHNNVTENYYPVLSLPFNAII